MILAFKALIGAMVVIIIALLSKTKSYYIAGLIPLFPTFALIGHYIIFHDNGSYELKQTVLFGMLSLIPYFIYLLGVYFLIDRLGFWQTVGASILFWVIVSTILIYGWKQYILPANH